MKDKRICSNCGKEMDEGYVWDLGYACSDACLFVDGYTPEMRDEDYENDLIFYTEWNEDD